MWSLCSRLWKDTVGASIAGEMAMVTSVTVGALFMSMGNFSVSVDRRFQQAATSTSVGTAQDVTAKKKREDDEKIAAAKAKKERFLQARKERLEELRRRSQSPQ